MNDIGLFILSVDTRWIVVGAVFFLVAFSLVLKFVNAGCPETMLRV